MPAGTMCTFRREVQRRPVVCAVLITFAAALGSLWLAPQAAIAASRQESLISSGFERSCAIGNGEAYCWGDKGTFSQLGGGGMTGSGHPVAVDTSGTLAGKTLTQISAGSDPTCEQGLVFTITLRTRLDAGNIRRSLRAICRKAGIGENWTPRELRHTFVSLLSGNGMAIEDISHLVGHSSTLVT
jgi:hypothetical protein